MENPHLMALQLSAHPEPCKHGDHQHRAATAQALSGSNGSTEGPGSHIAPVLGLIQQQSRDGNVHQPEQLTADSSPYLCVLPDGEFLTLGLLECIDRNPELTVSHTRRWALVKFLWGACRQRQR